MLRAAAVRLPRACATIVTALRARAAPSSTAAAPPPRSRAPRPDGGGCGGSPAPPPAAAPAAPVAPAATLYAHFPVSLPAGPPPAGPFAVDAAALRREFLRLQAAAHPDKHPPARKAAAEAASAALNHAHRTLADPLLRAQYLLALRGRDVAADETLRLDPADPADARLLTDVLAAREAIESAPGPEHLVGLGDANQRRIRASHDALARAFAADDIDAAAHEAVRLRYWVNVQAALDEAS